MVGWLSYWLFLLYANNPSVAAELSSSLQRFPQLSFSTIDIAVMVIIAALAVTLAFKFQRGLRPGIRLERALQMLESVMKRNLVLEAQVAELKIEKSHPPPPVITSIPTPSVSAAEPGVGSWEKAFRTPLEAGPPVSSKASSTTSDQIPFGHETGVPPPRIEAKGRPLPPMIKPPITISDKASEKTTAPPLIIPERPIDKPMFTRPPKPPSGSWEDSPQFIGESKGILTPSSSARKAPTVSESGGLKQPYIPAPAPKPTPSITVGPMPAPTQKTPAFPPPARITARPATRTATPKTTLGTGTAITPPVETPKPETVLPPPIPSPTPFPERPPTTENNPSGTDTSTPKPTDVTGKTDDQDISKLTAPTRKRLSLDS